MASGKALTTFIQGCSTINILFSAIKSMKSMPLYRKQTVKFPFDWSPLTASAFDKERDLFLPLSLSPSAPIELARCLFGINRLALTWLGGKILEC